MSIDGEQWGVVVVGAGHAGGTAASQLRSFGYGGSLLLIGDEPTPPYQRPPLSKAWLVGEADLDALKLRPDPFYADRGVALRLGTKVESIDRAAKRLVVTGGETISYTHLVLATGARPRALSVPGSGLRGVLELRNTADANRLRRALRPGTRLAVVGGGYLGLEIAASARALGAHAVVLEREPRVLARVASDVISDFFERYHRTRGVSIMTGARVAAFERGADESVAAVRLERGTAIACDAAVVCVGAVPDDRLARAAGLACRDGVVVDEDGRTEDPSVFAIGDLTRRPVPLYRRSVRLESVPNALEQGKRAAAAICGVSPGDAETPWFWSDQFDLKLQIAGLPVDVDRTVVRGSADEAAFAVFHLKGDVVQAVEAVNAPAEFAVGRRLIGERTPISVGRLGDRGVPMSKVAAPVGAARADG